MTRNLREQFELAVADDPGVAPGEMAQLAISEGARLRRRRHRLSVTGAAAGLAAAIGAVAGLNLLLAPPKAADPPATVAAALMPATAPACTYQPDQRDATDVVVFLRFDATGGQGSALEQALKADPRVDVFVFESREEAYQRFRDRWSRNPDLLAAVTAERFPEAFRLRLTDPAEYLALRSRYATMDGVGQISGRTCRPDAPVGGIL